MRKGEGKIKDSLVGENQFNKIHLMIQSFGDYLKLSFIFIVVPSFSINAQSNQNDIPAVSKGNIQFYVDHAAFAGKENKTYEEFYLMIYADQIKYVSNGAQKIGSFMVKASIKNLSTDEKIDKDWVTEAALNNDSSGIKTLVLYDQWSESISPGNYKLNVEVIDRNNTDNSGELSAEIEIPSFDKEKFTASQIEFVSSIDDKSSNDHFKKGTKNIIPSPSRRFGILSPVLYFYYEIYNISVGNIKLHYTVIDKEGKTVKSLPEMSIDKSSQTETLIHGINVNNLPSGIYKLNIRITAQFGDKENISRNFEVIQMDYASKKPSFTEEQAETADHYLKYIATKQEYELYQKLDLSGKGKFLISFWTQYNPSPGSPQNKYLQDVQNRYVYANEHFGWGKTEGWATDRGRVLIQNGMPDDIEQHLYDPEALPYEIWKYQKDRDYEFVFVDLKSIGRFDLVHSNKEGEVHNDQWQELLNKL